MADVNPRELERTNVLITMSNRLKDILDREANKTDESLSGFLRRVCAEYVGYDLEAESKEFIDKRKLSRPRKYKNAEERKQAYNARQRERYANQRQLMEDFRRQMRKKDIAALTDSLERRESK